MNTKNNQRAKNTEMQVEAVFLSLLSQNHITKITVRQLCERAGITRTSFYAHYEDVYDLLRKVEHKVTSQIIPFFQNETTQEANISKDSFIQLFRFIGENKSFYQYYFKNTDAEIASTMKNLAQFAYNEKEFTSERQYRIAFFMGGLNAIIKQWLERDCSDTPEELVSILEIEYAKDKTQ